ncbi:MAG TPA: cation diffusion facilitator family transporter [Candidatus Dorea intestinavium]|nr:cation diffusion facilitator family transporter [Candidatus Dorea intestinavium]
MKKTINQVTLIDTVGNVSLSAMKLTTGFFSGSQALISDGLHSLSDVMGAFIMFVGVKISDKDPDKDYPYGYEKIESVTAIIMAMILFSAGLSIGLAGLERIIHDDYKGVKTPGVIALIVACISILVKEFMFWYMKGKAKIANSEAILAEAWHQRADGIGSIGSLIGVMGARMGYPVVDSLASLAICVFVLKTAIGIFKESANKITDKAIDPEIHEEILKITKEQENVLGVQSLKTRQCGDGIEIQLVILVDTKMTLGEVYEVKNAVKTIIMAKINKVKNCIVIAYPKSKELVVINPERKI